MVGRETAERVAVWQDAAQKRKMKSLRTEAGGTCVKVIAEMQLPVGADLILTYSINDDGKIMVDMDYKPKANNILTVDVLLISTSTSISTALVVLTHGASVRYHHIPLMATVPTTMHL